MSAPGLLGHHDYMVEIRIAADPAAVWTALTQDIGQWWPSLFYCGSGSGTARFQLEARPGGRMWEDWGDGEGLLWGTVVNVQNARRLDLVGTAGPAWGGPSTSYASFDLQGDDSGTLLRFRDAAFGVLAEGGANEKEKGWRFLLDALAAHVEGRPAPVWSD